MDERQFGDILSERRKQLGLTIDQAVSATKLRPHVLEAFEASNFAAMPPKGYAQGMISSYARFLRLDPREVIEAYFDQLYLFEREQGLQNRSDRSPRYESPSEVARRRRAPGRAVEINEGVGEPSRRSSRASQTGAGLNAGYAQTSSHDRSLGNVYRRERRDPFSASSASRTGSYSADLYNDEDFHDDFNDYSDGYEESRNPYQRRGSSINLPGDSFTDRLRDFLPFILIALAVILVVLIVVFVLRGCSGDKNSDADQPQGQIPVVATTDTPSPGGVATVTPDSTAAQTTGTAAVEDTVNAADSNGETTENPDDTGVKEVEIVIEDGGESWVEAKVDDKTVVARTVNGGESESFTVNNSATITIGKPQHAKVLVNGQEVEIPRSSGIGKVSIKANE